MAETNAPETTAAHTVTPVAGPPAGYGSQPSGRPQHTHGGGAPVKRQIVAFSFYRILPEWKRLSAAEKPAHKAAFIAVIEKWQKPGEFLTMTYSTVGTRGDVDMLVWSICYSVEEMNRMRSELLATPLGGYIEIPHNFLSMTKRSQYQIDREDESEGEGRGAI